MNRDIEYTLCNACVRGDLIYVKELLPCIKLNYNNTLLYDAMVNACIGGHYEICLYLHKCSDLFDQQLTIADFNELLWLSGYHNQQQIMHWLIQMGATDHKYMTATQTAAALNEGLEIHNQHVLFLQITRQKTQSQLASNIQTIYDNIPKSYYDSNISSIFNAYVPYEYI